MIDIKKIKKEIIVRLKPLNLEKVILFGSYASENNNQDSDIDLYVVTNDDFIPRSWSEKSKISRNVSKKLRDLRKLIAIDLIVHTKKMNQNFIKTNSSIFKEIYDNGEELL